MKTLTATSEKILKAVHITSMSVWFSSLLIMYVISASISTLGNNETFYYAHKITSTIDFRILTPAAIITFLTGLIYGKFTTWKLRGNKWLLIKLILTIVLVVMGTIWLGPTLSCITEDAKEMGTAVLSDSAYITRLTIVKVFTLINAVALLYAIFISSIKLKKTEE